MRGQHPSWGECLFLSTLSLRRATIAADDAARKRLISIHALLAESDKARSERINQDIAFLSTLSLRRATANSQQEKNNGHEFLSTLSLRRATGAISQLQCILGDFYPRSPCGERHPQTSNHPHNTNFYPRSPCGERLRGWTLNINGAIFLSTLSLRRATRGAANCYLDNIISIHALLAESDLHNTKNNCIDYCDFYPRSPCGERPTAFA